MPYKQSKYNYFIDYKGGKLLYNGMSGAGFRMPANEWEELERQLKNLSQFEQKYPDDFLRLKNLGMIVESQLDEVALIKHLNKTALYDNRDYEIMINPTLECCFKCWYCFETHPQGHMSIAMINAIKEHIRYKIINDRISRLHISWFGGEPLLYFDQIVSPISHFAKQLAEENHVQFSNSITTNGYLINEKMVHDMSIINLHFFQITLDGDRERHDKIRNCNGAPSYDIIVSNIKQILEKIPRAQVMLRINYDDTTLSGNMQSLLDDYPYYLRNRIHIDFQRVWQTLQGIKDVGENIKLDTIMEQAISNGYRCYSTGGLHPGRFYRCHIGKNNFACINYDGNVFKCIARPFDESHKVGTMNPTGRISWDMTKLCRYQGYSPLEDECEDCVYLPLCMGPCPQSYMENGFKVNCYFKKIERSPEKRIIDLYEESLKDKHASFSY